MEARDAFWREPAHRIGRPRPLVAASVGPYGAFLADGSEYRGDYGLSEAELMDFHRPRMAALLEAGADLLACETIPCFVEARALARLLAEFPNASAWFSFSARDEAHLWHGERLAECAAWLDDQPQVVAVGVNCTAPRYLPALIEAARAVTGKPIVVYPNSGETYDPDAASLERRLGRGSLRDRGPALVRRRRPADRGLLPHHARPHPDHRRLGPLAATGLGQCSVVD